MGYFARGLDQPLTFGFERAIARQRVRDHTGILEARIGTNGLNSRQCDALSSRMSLTSYVCFVRTEKERITMVAQETQQDASPETSVPSAELPPDYEQIASLAYALWQQRGCPEGSPGEDWFRAEKELLARSKA